MRCFARWITHGAATDWKEIAEAQGVPIRQPSDAIHLAFSAGG